MISEKDIKLINTIIKEKNNNLLECSLIIRKHLRMLRELIINILKKIKLYDIAKKIYFKVKSKNE